MAVRRRNLADRLRWYWKLQSRTDTFQVRHLGTSLLALMRRSNALVIETTGRRTGRRRRSAVMYWEQDGAFFIGGGAAGMSRVDWVANLKAHPDAVAWVKREAVPVRARLLEGDERVAAQREAFERWPGSAAYERKSGRPIPYFRLDPMRRGDAGDAAAPGSGP